MLCITLHILDNDRYYEGTVNMEYACSWYKCGYRTAIIFTGGNKLLVKETREEIDTLLKLLTGIIV